MHNSESDATVSLPEETFGQASIETDSNADELAISASRLTTLGILLEAALFLIALAIAWFGFFDQANPPGVWFDGKWSGQIAIGTLLALPLLFLVLVVLPQINGLESFFEFVDEKLAPIFKSLAVWQIAAISLAAGVGEEVLFRWCLQGGLMQFFDPVWSILIASVIFGAAHAINVTYFLMAGLLGAVLAMIYLNFGLLAAVACHAMYDFVAILYLARKQGDALPISEFTT